MSKAQRQLQKQFAHIRSIDPATVVDPKKRFQYNIKSLAEGSVFRLNGQTYLVLELGTYTETDDQFKSARAWTGHELKTVCLDTGATHNIEWEEDDEVEVTVTLEEVQFADLYYDDGESIAQDSDDLDEIVEKKWEIVCRDKTFYYSDDYAAWYTRKDGDKKENVYFYEFESEDEVQITIEVWVPESGKETFQVFISKSIDPDDLEVVAVAH